MSASDPKVHLIRKVHGFWALTCQSPGRRWLTAARTTNPAEVTCRRCAAKIAAKETAR